MIVRLVLLSTIVFLVIFLHLSDAFVPPPIERRPMNTVMQTRVCMTGALFEDIHEPTPEEHIPAVELQDKNGKRFEVGCVVRVASDRVKAFHVSPAGRGRFDDKKQFQPGVKSLLLPVGLRGVVTRVYDQNEISANFPIAVCHAAGATYLDVLTDFCNQGLASRLETFTIDF